MPSKRLAHLCSLPLLTISLLFASGCQVMSATPAAPTPAEVAGLSELDLLISDAVSGDASALVPYFEYTHALCTTEPGLGGPPKCLPGEHDGTPVAVLPVLGPGEGGFIRELDAPDWTGPRLARLYAAYEVSEQAYSDPDYPAGELALVFVTADDPPMPVTLQVRAGRIVRIDYGTSWPPLIPTEAVEDFLVIPH